MNMATKSEWAQIKAKLKEYREGHFRDGMLRAAALVEAFPCRSYCDQAKMQRVVKMLRREANQDRRGKA